MVGAIYLLDMSVLLYNPDRKNKNEFIAEFVIRTKIFEEIWADIVSGKMKTPEQHYLLLGQRGAGKTTLLLRLKYAVEDDAKLSKWLIPVMFSEEQYNIGELGNLWERIAEYLEDYHGFQGITNEIEPFIQQDNYEEAALKVLIKHLDHHQKKVILFVDNIGQLLAKFSQLEVHRLREILQTLSHFRLVAGSPVVLESVLDYQQPLFEFFKVIQLKGLTDEESIVLLRKLAALHHEEEKIERIIEKSPSRITTLRTLSGGVPRTMVLLFQVFVDSEHGTALTDLEKVLDAVTPLYKHRMDDLPAQQQKIVDAVALHWEAISVKELAKQVRLDSKLVSAQLRQLEKNQVIEKRATKTKNHIYLLQERFFNIWYLMRYGRKQDRNRVIWLVKFLEVWCDNKEIELRILDYIQKVKNGVLDINTLEIYGQAYTFFKNITPETKFLLKESTPYHISSGIDLTESDLYSLLDRSLQKGDYENFFKVCVNKKIEGKEERSNLYNYLDKNVIDNFGEILKNNHVQVAKLISISNVRHFPYFHFSLALIFSKEAVRVGVTFKNTSIIESSADNVLGLLESYNVNDFIEEEERALLQIIMYLLVGKYYQLVFKIFDSNKFWKNEFDSLYKVALCLSSEDKREDILLNLGAEYKEILSKWIEMILVARKVIDEKND